MRGEPGEGRLKNAPHPTALASLGPSNSPRYAGRGEEAAFTPVPIGQDTPVPPSPQ
jgi:hypothetical protein